MRNKTKDKKGVQPKLRFPDFRNDGDWQEKKLSDLLSEPKKRNRDLRYSAEDVLSVSGEYGCVNQIQHLGRSYAGVSVANYHVVETGDIVYTKSPLKKNPYGIIKENKGKAGIVSTLYAVYRATKICHPSFLDHYFSRDYNLNSYLQPLVKKGAKNDMKVNNSYVLSGDIYAPEKKEQQKIADCLSSLDDLIMVERQKLMALKDHKKGLMQELFPAEGQNLPKRRFPEFKNAPEWEEKPLKKIAEVLPGFGFPEKYQGKISGKYPFYKVSDISNSLQSEEYFIKSSANYIDDTTLKILRARPLPVGTTIFARIGEAIRLNRRAITTVPSVIDNNVAGLKSIEGQSTDLFVYYTLLRINLSDHSGGAVPSVNKSTIEGIPVICPDLTEQKRIADFLLSIDDLITAQSQKLDTLRDHKKGLMQQLFPAASEVHG